MFADDLTRFLYRIDDSGELHCKSLESGLNSLKMSVDRFPTTRIPQTQLQILVQQFEDGMRHARGTTRHVYKKGLDQLLVYAKTSTFKFTPDDFSEFRLWLFNQKKLSINTVNTYLTASRRFCDFLVEMGVLRKNPGWNFHGTAQSYSILKVKLPEVSKAIAGVDRGTVLGKRDFAFLLAIFECGASISELINADIGDLKRNGNVTELHVKPKGTRGKFEIIKLTPTVSSAISDYIALRGIVASNEPIFGTVCAGKATKKRLSFRGVRAAMRRYLKFERERTMRLDSLRTYCAVRLMTQGKSSEEIRSLMRFKSNMPFRKIMLNTKAIAEAK